MPYAQIMKHTSFVFVNVAKRHVVHLPYNHASLTLLMKVYFLLRFSVVPMPLLFSTLLTTQQNKTRYLQLEQSSKGNEDSFPCKK